MENIIALNRLQKLIFYLSLSGLFSGCRPALDCYHGSTAICILGEEDILIAADSKLVSTKSGKASTTCKVGTNGSIVYACTGLLGTTNGRIDIVKEISKVTTDSQELREKVNQVYNEISNTLMGMVINSKINNPKYYEEELLNKNVFSAVFGAMIKGKPEAAALDVMFASDGSLNYLVPTTRIAPPLSRIFIGNQNAVDSVFKENPEFLLSFNSYTKGIRELIIIQSASTPKKVDKNVNIISLDSIGVKWVERRMDCY